ncbi:MIT C-terminal domain-containing protein [Campylobacter ureolyticus]|uniref:MIT C-terminal domain-containing protein n=1 Tax=Campylobacter ureolyticus TaxID=827 RepID=UPI000469BCDA|nr:MIT C-terminal domain-containing protein [Campylobacter ureolyticus]QIX86569.1 hypothetical protein FOB81_04415 [Campylobacter ureolyticus]STA71147.1 Uncharacterised protein [Campylobacter ureolyticus]
MYLVVEDDLFIEYLKFTRNLEYKKDTIKKILRYHKDGFLPTLNQLELAEKEIDGFDKSVFSPLFNRFKINVSLLDLANQTKLKLILSNDKNHYPYVNINGDVINNNISATFKPEETRQKAKEHFKNLLSDAKTILIKDDYMFYNFNNLSRFAKELIPKKQLNIFYYCKRNNTQQHISSLKQIHNEWKIKEDKNDLYKDTHDRYILINQEIEIILSSGIHYLYDEDKDFTYTIRFL